MDIERLSKLPQAEDRINFEEIRQELLRDHSDMPDTQLRRWEQLMIDRDELAIGAITAMMQVRNFRIKEQRSSRVA